MQRRTFLKHLGVVSSAVLIGDRVQAAVRTPRGVDPELNQHSIDRIQFERVHYHWPRLVGKNARLDVHGQHKSAQVVKLHTDQGAMGWGMVSGNAEAAKDRVQGKTVAELIDPAQGIVSPALKPFDFVLHDLAGIILNQPVHQLLGAQGPRANPIYSGMIYFDELEPPDHPAGIDKVMENCQWDVDYGYRQVKVKIGRGNRWYPHDAGLQMDIEVLRRIHETFKDRNIGILVDANDGYSLDDAIAFLKGVEGIPLFWVEEPFPEEREKSGTLREWMHANGFGKTCLADGEFNPDPVLCLNLAREGVLDVCLHDINGYGFTRWRQLMPELKACGTLASPHAWGSRLKTHYTAQMAAGLGNCCTIEGVSCESDEIDFGDYPIVDGKLRASDAPGFGMRLLV
jgi:L-alanine-DL-glutamate epimerase-like enolase superfamily enzyme